MGCILLRSPKKHYMINIFSDCYCAHLLDIDENQESYLLKLDNKTIFKDTLINLLNIRSNNHLIGQLQSNKYEYEVIDGLKSYDL